MAISAGETPIPWRPRSACREWRCVAENFCLEHSSAETLAPALLTSRYLPVSMPPEWRPGYGCRGERLAGREKFSSGGAFDEAVLNLKAGDGSGATQPRRWLSPAPQPRREVGKTRIENLPGPDEVVEAQYDLLDRCDAVGI